MIFQIIDEKSTCPSVYSGGELLLKEQFNENMTSTWKYSPFLEGGQYDCASLYCNGENLDQVCPPGLRESWSQASGKMAAFLRAFNTVGVELSEACLVDLVPDKVIKNYCLEKERIIEHVLDSHKKPENYEFLYNSSQIIEDVKRRELKIDLAELNNTSASPRALAFRKKINQSSRKIDYNLFGSRTGRLSTNKGSFPIMTLDKEFRKIIKPTNDLFIELDFNGAEIRTLLALSGQGQPDLDIHVWNLENASTDLSTRQEMKERFFAWLYNPTAKDQLLEKFYNRDRVKDEFWDKETSTISTIFGRKIKVDDRRALNYIIQSTTSDILLEQASQIRDMLKGTSSEIAFLMHDSIILDFCSGDSGVLKKIVNAFSTTRLGRYKANVKLGKNYKDMKDLEL